MQNINFFIDNNFNSYIEQFNIIFYYTRYINLLFFFTLLFYSLFIDLFNFYNLILFTIFVEHYYLKKNYIPNIKILYSKIIIYIISLFTIHVSIFNTFIKTLLYIYYFNNFIVLLFIIFILGFISNINEINTYNILSNNSHNIYSSNIIQETYNNKHLNEQSCSICKENYNINDIILMLSCSHFFHKNCAEHWISIYNKCPYCNKLLLYDNR